MKIWSCFVFRGYEIVPTRGSGPEFFGLSHPIVQNLIQSCPGARKCTDYKWIKFEVSKTENISSFPPIEYENPTISVEALHSQHTFTQGKEKITIFILFLLVAFLRDRKFSLEF